VERIAIVAMQQLSANCARRLTANVVRSITFAFRMRLDEITNCFLSIRWNEFYNASGCHATFQTMPSASRRVSCMIDLHV
jgi:hypothetical protein